MTSFRIFKKHVSFCLIFVHLTLFPNITQSSEHKELNNLPEVEILSKFNNIRPKDVIISHSGRTFLSLIPSSNSETKLVELFHFGETKPYPNTSYATGEKSTIQSAISIKLDSKDRLWILDNTLKRLIIWNTKTFALFKILEVPKETLINTSYLQDFVLDERKNRVIISDSTHGSASPSPALIVMDIITANGTRIAQNHHSLASEKTDKMHTILMAADPDQEWLYFGTMYGRTLFRAPMTALDSEKKFIANIKEFSRKPYSNSIAVNEHQYVYLSNIQDNTIGVIKENVFKNIAKLPKGQSWPDGLLINDGYVYSVVNQLDKSTIYNDGNELSKLPFLLVRTKLAP